MAVRLNTEHKKLSKRQQCSRSEVSLPIVHLGTTIKGSVYADDDVVDLWAAPIYPSSRSVSWQKVRCPKYRNLFEFSKSWKHGINKKLWKVPGWSNNLPVIGCEEETGKIKEKGLYKDSFRKWIERIDHENTIILPPLQTSGRMKDNVYDSARLKEKEYIRKVLSSHGQIEKFERDEVYIPSSYREVLSCKDCRRYYVSSMYTQRYVRRNESVSPCHNSKGVTSGSQYCDVLGERFCLQCIENREKRFSRKVEGLANDASHKGNSHFD